MPVFRFQIRCHFNPGHVDGSTEEPPNDLLGDDGRVMTPLAVWPEQPLRVEASDEATAWERAKRKLAEDGRKFWIDQRIGEARFEALRRRPNPGSEGKISSVVEMWIAQAEGEDGWRECSWTTNIPK
jgi:hypothetical protein